MHNGRSLYVSLPKISWQSVMKYVECTWKAESYTSFCFILVHWKQSSNQISSLQFHVLAIKLLFGLPDPENEGRRLLWNVHTSSLVNGLESQKTWIFVSVELQYMGQCRFKKCSFATMFRSWWVYMYSGSFLTETKQEVPLNQGINEMGWTQQSRCMECLM